MIENIVNFFKVTMVENPIVGSMFLVSIVGIIIVFWFLLDTM